MIQQLCVFCTFMIQQLVVSCTFMIQQLCVFCTFMSQQLNVFCTFITEQLVLFCIFIGLRASNVSLQKLKCSKCDFQAYYEHQYQEHIATHTDQTLKCKCCKFVAFEKSDLVDHFKVCVVERRWRSEYDEVVTCVND